MWLLAKQETHKIANKSLHRIGREKRLPPGELHVRRPHIVEGNAMPQEPKRQADPRQYWREKLDEHEKLINALLIGMAGGLLAFSADYVKDSVANFGMYERVLAGIAVASASLSLAIGACRTLLRTRLYGFELSSVDYREAKQIYDEIAQKEDEWAKAAAEAIRQTPGLPDEARAQAVGKAVADVYDRRFDAMVLQIKALIAQAQQLRSVHMMDSLLFLQIGLFIAGALSIAFIVFRQLAA